jgi:succinate-semialdehyde dehydrogenase/glutarate-semialdehyde dehydrogenase
VPDSGADERAPRSTPRTPPSRLARTPAKQRAQLLKRWNDLIVQHQEDLGALISREQGKPLAEGAARCCTRRATSSGSPRRRRAPTAT